MGRKKSTAVGTGLDMATWGPGVEHWKADDGRFFAVMVDETGAMPVFVTAVLDEILGYDQLKNPYGNEQTQNHILHARPTTVVACDEQGIAIDADTSTPAVELLTVHSSAPGTSAADALIEMGYTVKKGR